MAANYQNYGNFSVPTPITQAKPAGPTDRIPSRTSDHPSGLGRQLPSGFVLPGRREGICPGRILLA